MKLKLVDKLDGEREIDVAFPAYFLSIREGVEEGQRFSCTTVLRLEGNGSQRTVTLYTNGPPGVYGHFQYEMEAGTGGNHAELVLDAIYACGELEPCNSQAFYDALQVIRKIVDAAPKQDAEQHSSTVN